MLLKFRGGGGKHSASDAFFAKTIVRHIFLFNLDFILGRHNWWLIDHFVTPLLLTIL